MTPISKTFRFVPQLIENSKGVNAAKDDSLLLLRQVIETFLKEEGWQPAKDDSKLDLLVLIPRNNDEVTVSDACWLSENAGQYKVCVLIFDAYGRFPQLPKGVLSWLYVTRVGFSSASLQEQLAEWAEESLKPLDNRERKSVDELKKCILDNSIRSSTDGTDFDRFLEDKNLRKFIGQKTTPRLLQADSRLDFYYGLIRLGGKYSRIEHDLNRVTANLIRENNNYKSLAELGQLRRIRQFMDACRDAFMVLRYPVLKPADSNRNVILLIDDRPELIKADLNKIIGYFLEGYKLWIWNPRYEYAQGEKIDEKKQLLSLQDVVEYNSLRSKINPGDFVKILEEDKSLSPKFSKLCEQCAYFLVDVLFEIPGGGEAELGSKVISGLHRMIRDATTDVDGSSRNSSPTIIAISRADDQEKIQNCLLAGADGYILKSRLLSLPSVLGRLHHPVREPVSALHRNFRLLYNLPGEVISLLKATSIKGIDFRKGKPCKPPSEGCDLRLMWVDTADDLVNEGHNLVIVALVGTHLHIRIFDANGTRIVDKTENELVIGDTLTALKRQLNFLPDESGLSQERKQEIIEVATSIAVHTPSEQQRALAQLLTAIPKLDVHVHVGSLMTPEFLTIASIVMLVRHELNSQTQKDIENAIKPFCNFWRGTSEKALYLHPDLCFLQPREPLLLKYKNDEDGVKTLAKDVREFLIEQIRSFQSTTKEKQMHGSEVPERYYRFRSILHKVLGVRDHWSEDRAIKKIQGTPNLTLFFFAHAYCVTKQATEYQWVFKRDPDRKLEEVLRMYILFLAAQKEDNRLKLKKWDLLAWFRPLAEDGSKAEEKPSWENLYDFFYGDPKINELSHQALHNHSWKAPTVPYDQWVTGRLCGELDNTYPFPLSKCPSFDESPIEWLLATGTRCTDLTTYLEGCELSGAEHLRHPYLVHLYAQHVVYQFARLGVFYAELRAAITGYECKEIGFSFKDACDCFVQAFTEAQQAIYQKYRHPTKSQPWLWQEPFKLDDLSQDRRISWKADFPVKVGVILTGKRHKPTREMLREAAGAVVLHTRPDSDLKTARDFVQEQIGKCRLVGFDLAGQEDEYPPERFRTEFEQLARLHVPITAHAGENAHAGFVESAVMDLRARRLGHGLALPEDPQLMARVREDRVCVELCPVSNFQTSRFGPAGENGHARGHEREYPLRRLLANGNAVCINTDNPIISYTNIIKEYFQASYAYGGSGLSLWELLRIIRMGFVHSFMNMPERRAVLELVDQILFDLFSNPDVIALLRELARPSPSSASKIN